jgi:hypothetical protein
MTAQHASQLPAQSDGATEDHGTTFNVPFSLHDSAKFEPSAEVSTRSVVELSLLLE